MWFNRIYYSLQTPCPEESSHFGSLGEGKLSIPKSTNVWFQNVKMFICRTGAQQPQLSPDCSYYQYAFHSHPSQRQRNPHTAWDSLLESIHLHQCSAAKEKNCNERTMGTLYLLGNFVKVGKCMESLDPIKIYGTYSFPRMLAATTPSAHPSVP